MDGPLRLLQYFYPRLPAVGQVVGRVFKLLGDIHLGVPGRHVQGGFQAAADAVPNVPAVVDQHYLRPVVAHQLAALLAYRIGHDDNGAVPPHRPDEGQADPLVAAGGLHNHGVRPDSPLLLRLENHGEGGPGLDGAAHVYPLEFHQHLGAFRAAVYAPQADEGGVPHRLQDVFVYHCNASLRADSKSPVRRYGGDFGIRFSPFYHLGSRMASCPAKLPLEEMPKMPRPGPRFFGGPYP